MPESWQWQGALAGFGIEAKARTRVREAGVTLVERAPTAQLALRGDASSGEFQEAISGALGMKLPSGARSTATRDGDSILSLGPDEWLVVLAMEVASDRVDALSGRLSGTHHALVDVTHSRTVIGLIGDRAREVLMKATNVDVHPRAFSAGQCIQTHLARCHMLLHQLDESPAYDIYVHRSFAAYAWAWLLDAAGEYGVAVQGILPVTGWAAIDD